MIYWLTCVAIIIRLDQTITLSVKTAWVIGICMGIVFERLKYFLENRIHKETQNDKDIHR